MSVRCCRWIAALLMLAGPSACPDIARAQHAAHALRAGALIPTLAGDFGIALPSGWTATASPGGDSLTLRPRGERQPTAYMIVVSVSDLRYQTRIAACGRGYNPYGNALTQCVIPSVQLQLNDSREWAVTSAFRLILERLEQSGRRFTAPMLTPSGPTRAFFQVASTGPAGPAENWGVVSMSYLGNPMLGPDDVTSLVLIKGCSAPPQLTTDQFRRTCAGVLNSLRTSPTWGSRLAAEITDIYLQEADILVRMGRTIERGAAARERMIAGFGQSMQWMQLETFETMRKANYRAGQGWIAAFAGNTLVRDAATGRLYSVPYGYESYGIDDRGPVPVIIYGNDVKPGISAGGATVQRMLAP
jgi:hypothetical protein